MKFLDGLLAFLFNFCLLFVTAVVSVFAIASSPAYYYEQFEKTGIYAQMGEDGELEPKVIRYIGGDRSKSATFTDEQLDEIIDHIITYMFTDQESFELVMDDVKVNGTTRDGVSIFGETAVVHMEDVKGLLQTLGFVAIGLGVAGIAMLIYFIVRVRKGKCGILLKSTAIFYATFVGLIGAFCLFTLIQMLVTEVELGYFLDMIWRNFHFLIFPAEQATGSFFNDTLTMILTLDLFMSAVVQVLVIIACAVVLWMVVAGILDKRVKSFRNKQNA